VARRHITADPAAYPTLGLVPAGRLYPIVTG
jgi:hypothetical protein